MAGKKTKQLARFSATSTKKEELKEGEATRGSLVSQWNYNIADTADAKTETERARICREEKEDEEGRLLNANANGDRSSSVLRP